jgi:hypothetical protein
MNSIFVSKIQLLEILTGNRSAHQEIFKEAQKGYRSKAIELLDKALEEARHGGKITVSFMLPAPQDHTADYDRVIRMLEMSVDSEIQIEEDQFQMYVMDDWTWKRAFMENSTMYAGTL